MSRGTWPGWLHWVPAVAWAAVIFALSSQTWLPPTPDGMTDKHGHGLVFGILALACIHGLTAGQWRLLTGRTAGTAVVLAVVYGMSDEFHQSFVPGRTADWADVRADAIGAVVAATLAWAWAILLRRRVRRRVAGAAGGRPPRTEAR